VAGPVKVVAFIDPPMRVAPAMNLLEGFDMDVDRHQSTEFHKTAFRC
jgi:hypothetical protein